MARLIPALLLAALVAGCAHAPRKSDWPSLAPRAGEPLAVVAANCGGCGPPPVTQPEPVRGVEPVRALPADTEARLAAVDAALKPIEARLPAQGAETRKAVAAAQGRGETDDMAVTAEVQRTRLEALTLPLTDLGEQLDALSADIDGIDGAEPVKARIAAMAARIAAAQAAGSL